MQIISDFIDFLKISINNRQTFRYFCTKIEENKKSKDNTLITFQQNHVYKLVQSNYMKRQIVKI